MKIDLFISVLAIILNAFSDFYPEYSIYIKSILGVILGYFFAKAQFVYLYRELLIKYQKVLNGIHDD